MGANARTKGQSGEREVADLHNTIVSKWLRDNGFDALSIKDLPFQRNQNQSAVGGDDLTNPFHLSIEVKRQEQLKVNTWWEQTVQSAMRSGGVPILMYRQNRKAWNVVMYGFVSLAVPNYDGMKYAGMRVTISVDDYKVWFYKYLDNCLEQNMDWIKHLKRK